MSSFVHFFHLLKDGQMLPYSFLDSQLQSYLVHTVGLNRSASRNSVDLQIALPKKGSLFPVFLLCNVFKPAFVSPFIYTRAVYAMDCLNAGRRNGRRDDNEISGNEQYF